MIFKKTTMKSTKDALAEIHVGSRQKKSRDAMPHPRVKKHKIIFLDRDGVINKYPGDGKYVTRLSEFKFLKGAKIAIRKLTRARYRIFVVSNQAGVVKRIYSKKVLAQITRFMKNGVEKAGGKIQRVLYCLHTSEMKCPCRKPKPGLLREATKNLSVDFGRSFFIGDSLMDVAAGKAFGCKTILVLSGREKMENAHEWDVVPDFVARSLLEAAENIIANRYDRA